MSQNKSRYNLWHGIMGSEVVLATAGKPAAGNIAFTANPTEGDSFTINSTVFTFWDSGNEPGTDATVEITIGVDLATSLASAETKVEAHGTVGKGSIVLINVDVTNTNADLSFTSYPGVTPALVSSTNGANTADTVFTGAVSTPAVDVTDVQKAQVVIDLDDQSAAAVYVTLGDGEPGQEVMLYDLAQANASDSVVFVGSFGGVNNLATIDAAGDYSNLRFMDGAWRVTYDDGTNGVALSNSTAVAL